jgi:hypothetical protein
MEVRMKKIPGFEPELVEIRCHEVREEVIISRKYVPDLKKTLKGEG